MHLVTINTHEAPGWTHRNQLSASFDGRCTALRQAHESQSRANWLALDPFVLSPSTGSGQALSKHILRQAKLDKPTFLEHYILSSVRYEADLHGHAVVHSDRAHRRETARCRLSVLRSRCRAVVQLLREHHVRLAILEGVAAQESCQEFHPHPSASSGQALNPLPPKRALRNSLSRAT